MTSTPVTWVAHPWVAHGSRRPRFAAHGGPYADWPRFLELVQRAESLGFDAYWMSDHPIRNPGCWTTLAALAVSTRSIRLGTLVNCVYYRAPFDLARCAADVDRMSNGRVIVGLGAGDDEREFEQLGISMPSARERLDAVEETVQVVRRLWGDTDTPASIGTIRPGHVQSPRISILLAGTGSRSLRLVAQYADAANFPLAPPRDALRAGVAVAPVADTLEAKLGLLQTHCATYGRPFASVVRSHMAPVVLADNASQLAVKLNALPERFRQFLPFTVTGTPEQAVETHRSLMHHGIDNFITLIIGDDPQTLELLAARVRPALESSVDAAATVSRN